MIQANIPAQPTADLGTSTWSREESTLVTTGDSVAKLWGHHRVMETIIFSKKWWSYIFTMLDSETLNWMLLLLIAIMAFSTVSLLNWYYILRYLISKFSKQMAFLLNSIWTPQPRPCSLGLCWGEVNCKDFFWNSIFNGGAGQRQTTQVMRQRPNILISSSSASAHTEWGIHTQLADRETQKGQMGLSYYFQPKIFIIGKYWAEERRWFPLLKEDGVVSDSECRWRY